MLKTRYQFILFIVLNCFVVKTTYGKRLDTSLHAVDTTLFANFKGGEQALFKFLGANIRYPKAARVEGISGTVMLRLLISDSGRVDSIKVIKGVGGGCTEEAARVFFLTDYMWKPPKKEGIPIKSYMYFPVTFSLRRGGAPPLEGGFQILEYSVPLTDGYYPGSFVSVEDYKKLGDEAIQKGDFNEALFYYDRLYKGDATNGEICYRVGMIYFQLDQERNACRFIKKAVKFGYPNAQKVLEQKCTEKK